MLDPTGGNDVAVSDRAARVARRAEERARHKAVLDAADPTAGGRAAHGLCAEPGCGEHGPAVLIGAVQIVLCPRHKEQLDESWARAAEDWRRRSA